MFQHPGRHLHYKNVKTKPEHCLIFNGTEWIREFFLFWRLKCHIWLRAHDCWAPLHVCVGSRQPLLGPSSCRRAVDHVHPANHVPAHTDVWAVLTLSPSDWLWIHHLFPSFRASHDRITNLAKQWPFQTRDWSRIVVLLKTRDMLPPSGKSI